MKSAIKIYLQAPLRHKGLILVLMILASLIESFGLATALPVLSVAAGEELGKAPKFVADMIATLKQAGLPTDFNSLLVLMLIGLIGREVVMFSTMSFVGFAIADLTNSYRWRLINAFMNARWDYFTREPVGQLAFTVTTFANQASITIQTVARLLATSLRVVMYLAVMVAVSGVFAIVAIIASAAIAFALMVFVAMARRAGEKEAVTLQKLSGRFTDLFGSIKAIKAMDRQGHMHQVFDAMIARLNKLLRRIVLAREALISSQAGLEILLVVAVFFTAVRFWNISVIEVGFLGALMMQVMKSVSSVQKTMQKVAQNEVYFWRLEKTVEEAEAAREALDGKVRPSLEEGIRLEKVGFAYGDKTIFGSADAFIPANRVSVIYGPSGQGKTTLIDLVIGLYKPDAGAITIDGVDLTDIDLKAWRGMIGYVPQDLILNSGTIRTNITLADPELDDEAVWQALEIAGAADFVRELPNGIDSEVGEQGVKLSGGQRQRLSLARGLVHKPRLLVLDEVTSALDPRTEKRICREIARLTGKTTVISITHRPAWLEVADKVIEVNAGHLREKAPGRARV